MIKRTLYKILRHTPGIGWLLRKISSIEQRLTKLERLPAESPVNCGKKVDLLDFGPVSIFMYVDDLAYQNTPQSVRNYDIEKHIEKMNNTNRSSWSSLDSPDKLNLLPWICRHYQQNSLPFIFFDVGCQYGAYSLYVAHIFRECGWVNRIIAFDIGNARDLVEYNIELNQQKDRVVFEPLAVSNHCLPSLVYTEYGRSENNRIVNRDHSSEYESYVVRSTTIDEYIDRNNIHENIVIKVDAQGGEYEIWQGMQKCLANRVVTALLEFTPHAIQSRIKSHDFLLMLSRDAFLIDVPPLDEPVRRIDPVGLIEFSNDVSCRKTQSTDILLVSKKLPDAGQLCDKIIQTN